MQPVSITERAALRIKEILVEQAQPDASLRVYVQGGGCSGFQYGMVIDEGTGNAEADQVFLVHGVRLLVDPISIRYLNGAEVDFVENAVGGDFSINNPSAKSTCGCGSSFKA